VTRDVAASQFAGASTPTSQPRGKDHARVRDSPPMIEQYLVVSGRHFIMQATPNAAPARVYTTRMACARGSFKSRFRMISPQTVSSRPSCSLASLAKFTDPLGRLDSARRVHAERP
jgi:hypothetical protein